MKSIMKLAERDAGHAALTAPRHQQHHNQFQSSLPNGKIELMWFVAADGALMGMELLKWDWIYWWVKGAAAPRQPANKETSWAAECLFISFFVDEMEMESNKEMKRWDWREDSSTTKQQSNQFLLCFGWNWWSCLVGWVSGVGFISLLSLFVGYGLLRQPMLRKEKRQAKREMKSMKWMKQIKLINQAARNEETINWAVRGKPTID